MSQYEDAPYCPKGCHKFRGMSYFYPALKRTAQRQPDGTFKAMCPVCTQSITIKVRPHPITRIPEYRCA